MKRTVTSDSEMPPGGWKLTVPETGHTVTAPYAKSLQKRVNDHRVANGHDPMPQDEFEDAACRESGHGAPWCGGVRGPVKPPNTLSRVKRFLRTMAKVASTRDFVDDAEHVRRMAICAGCPMMSLEGLGCDGCITELRAVERLLGKLVPGGAMTCTACGCLVHYKARVSNETLDAAEAGDPVSYDPQCWRLGN